MAGQWASHSGKPGLVSSNRHTAARDCNAFVSAFALPLPDHLSMNPRAASNVSLASTRLSLISAAILGAAMLAACGGGSSGGSGTPVAQAPTTPTTPTTPVETPVDNTPTQPDTPTEPTPPAGRWTIGDMHIHTYQSDDTQQTTTLDQVLAKAFNTFGLDWAAISDHLRVSSYDNNGNKLAAQIPFSEGMAKYQVPRIKALQAAGTYADKTIFASAEWDMPGHDHGNVGILTDQPMSDAALKAVSQFEYLFTNRPATQFPTADVTAWALEIQARAEAVRRAA